MLLGHASRPLDDDCGAAKVERMTFGHLYVTGCPRSPIVGPAEYDLIQLAPFGATHVVRQRFLPSFPARGSGASRVVVQRFAKPIHVMAKILKLPIDIRQTAHQRTGTDLVNDLACGHEHVEGPVLVVTDGAQLGVEAALGAGDQASTPVW